MPVQSKAPTRAELEKVFKRPLSDAEYRGMLNITPAPVVARADQAPPTSAVSPPQPLKEGGLGTHYTTAAADAPGVLVKPYVAAFPSIEQGMPHSNPGAAIATQPKATEVKPLFGLPSNATPEPQAKVAMPFWLADSAGGHAAGDVATAPEYVQMVQASKAPPVAPVATMPQDAPATQALADGATVVPASPAAAMIAPPKKEKK